MMFLIGKMFIYLILAGSVGGVAGWLFRNLQAQRTEEHANRAANDAKAKLPQLESLLRGRDEQITKLKDIVAEKKAELSEQSQQMRELEVQARDARRDADRWQHSAESKSGRSMDEFDIDAEEAGVTGDSDADSLIAELSSEISRLKTELSSKSVAMAEASASSPSGSDSTETESLLKMELEALRAQLAAAEKELAVVKSDLAHEHNKVNELERERELQNKSLQVLHQQLDLERTRRVANG